MTITYTNLDVYSTTSNKYLLPFKEGINNINLAFTPKIGNLIASINTTRPDYNQPLKNRLKHFVVGMILLIPIVNSFVLSYLKELDKKTIESVKCLQSIFKERQGRRIAFKREKAAAEKKLMETREGASTKIQTVFRGYQARKAFKKVKEKVASDKKVMETRQKAAVKIQSAFRGWAVREAIKQNKNVPQAPGGPQNPENAVVVYKPTPTVRSSTYWQKLIKFTASKKGIDLASSASGVNMHQASGSFSCALGSVQAIRQGKLKIGTVLAMQSVAQGINAVFNFFVPTEVRKLEKLSNPQSKGLIAD